MKPPTKRKLDASDIATILAALRMFQQRYEDDGAETIQRDFPDYFILESVEVEGKEELIVNPAPLGSEDIDELCEQINFGEVTL
jgi:hypothetical protein